jgi:phosphatidylserine/phosphatidylglycerophosphate/cardiolipin synthase-like enzyme
VEPADQERAVDQLLSGARRTIDLTMYELADPTAESLLIAAHRRGVAVRVLLDRAYSGGSVNQPAFEELTGAGVPVRWGPTSVIVHQKTLTVDGTSAAVMTGNLTARYYGSTRDVVIIDRDPQAVAAIEQVFSSDWSGAPVTAGPDVAGLVWSPGAEGALVSLIDSAHHTVMVENEEMDDTGIETALQQAAHRDVAVTVVMTADPEWDTAFAALRSAGVVVDTLPDSSTALYIHAKIIVVDGSSAYAGSQNFSTSSLGYNRELGLVTTDPTVVDVLATTVAQDEADAGGGAHTTPTSPPASGAAPTPSSAATGCTIDPEGRCYRADEYCPYSEHGLTLVGADGPLICVDSDGWRWEPAG